MPKVLAAMSGGVDSSVAARLLVDAGYDVAGATMRLFSNADVFGRACAEEEEGGASRACCSLSDVEDARAVCYKLGIEHMVFGFGERFRAEVMERFAESYRIGATPNPCIDCNRFIKFRDLLARAELLGYDAVATGHYARVERRADGRYLLLRGLDRSKDQSYVLYSLTQAQLAKTLFPVGGHSKEEIRALAAENGFINAQKPDSQDICFVPDGDYAAFIERFTGKKPREGDFLDTEGRVIGRHKGIIHYTIGQRKGLSLSFGKPMYVVKKDAENNTVTLGEERDLYSKTLFCDDVNLIPFDRLDGPLRVTAKTRYSQRDGGATLFDGGDGLFRVEFDEPQRAAAAGQAVVFYEGDLVVGGGTIIKT